MSSACSSRSTASPAVSWADAWGARLARSAEVAAGLAIVTQATDAAGGERVSVFDLPIEV